MLSCMSTSWLLWTSGGGGGVASQFITLANTLKYYGAAKRYESEL